MRHWSAGGGTRGCLVRYVRSGRCWTPALEPGARLSELPLQDSYSYELGRIFMGAQDEPELNARYERCLTGLPFEFDE